MRRHLRAELLLLALALPLQAQTKTGDVIAIGLSPSLYQIDGDSGVVQVLSPGSWGGLFWGAGAVLWDPASPWEVLIGGGDSTSGTGFIGRASLLPSSVPGFLADYSVISTGPWGGITRMSLDDNGNILFADASERIIRASKVTGTWTALTGAGEPWIGLGIRPVAHDRENDLYYLGSQDAVFTWTASTGGSLLSSGHNGSPSIVADIALDPFSSDIIICSSGPRPVLRIDGQGIATDMVPPGSIQGATGIAVDENGDFLVTGSLPSTYEPRIFRIANAGGMPQPLPTTPAVGGSELCVVGGLSYEDAPGPLTVSLIASPTGTTLLGISGIPDSSTSGRLLLSADVAATPPRGPLLGIVPDALTEAILGLTGGPQVGNPLWFTIMSPGVFPDVPLALPSPVATALSGTTFDFLCVTFEASLRLNGLSRVFRLTF